MRSIVFVACSFPLLAVAADTKVAKGDVSFVDKASKGSMFEVEAGKIAAEKGQSDAVKNFGQHLVDDHAKLNNELGTLAGQKGISVPTDIDAAQKKKILKLTELPAEKFDAEFVKAMIDDHQKDINAFEKAAKTAKDTELKDWITASLPRLKMHLEMAQKLKS